MIYVALLRGINVGGNNLVDMKKLKTTFESIGFRNVVRLMQLYALMLVVGIPMTLCFAR